MVGCGRSVQRLADNQQRIEAGLILEERGVGRRLARDWHWIEGLVTDWQIVREGWVGQWSCTGKLIKD